MIPQLVSHYAVDAVFPRAIPHFLKALEKVPSTDLTIPFLWSECSARRMYLYVDDLNRPNNAAIIKFQQWTSGELALKFIVMGGEGGEDWDQCLDYFARVAKENGAQWVTWGGRTGWERKQSRARKLYATYGMRVD